MAFSFAGAAGGVQHYLTQQDQRARDVAEFELRRQALAAQLESGKASAARAARDQQLQEAAIAMQQAGEMGQGTELSPDIVKLIQGTPYAARLESKQTLPVRSNPLLGIQGADNAGGQSYTTLAPTRKEMEDTAARTARNDLAGELEKGGVNAQTRPKLIGTFVRLGQNVPNELLKDPQAELADEIAKATAVGNIQLANSLREIAARGAEERRTSAATPRAGEFEWVERNGVPMEIRKGTAQPGDKPHSNQADKPPTQGQYTAANYAGRIAQAEDIFGQLEGDIAHMNPLSFSAQTRSPYAGFQSGQFQSYDQAARNFINAVLRRESGAAISTGEFDNARKQYLPQPGDDPATLRQKKANRDYVQQALTRESGAAYVPPIKPPAGGAKVKSITEVK